MGQVTEFERLPLPENFRAVVEGVGPTKPPPKQPRQRVQPKPKGARPQGEAPRDNAPKRKHPNRKGKPAHGGAQGRPAGGNRRRGNRRGRPGGQSRSASA
ncbi:MULTISPECIES: hypothetical protein [Alphaproteobacteria]|jgi:ATP-dependent RNA helicase RhlE|uniref:hypothetical protein n=1 Tax=Alphaproteobacteria TaxID=28211 RepID=UPI001B2A91F6|nr:MULTISPECIES: hypothetical protein [Alphaproteobacteria]MBO6693763.1 hypothetical protein [Parvibaculum sp.]